MPRLLLGKDLDEHRTKVGIERAVLDVLRRFGILPPEPPKPPPLRLVVKGHEGEQ
jgi:hypothetical protein